MKKEFVIAIRESQGWRLLESDHGLLVFTAAEVERQLKILLMSHGSNNLHLLRLTDYTVTCPVAEVKVEPS